GATFTAGTANQLNGLGGSTKTGVGGIFAITAANSYAGPVTVSEGNLLLSNPGALGSGSFKSTITLAHDTSLDLRSDGPFPANFGNDVVVLDNTPPGGAAAITLGQISGSTAGAFKLHGLRMGNAQLDITGSAGNSLEFNGIVTLNGEAKFNTTRDLLF